MAFPRLNALSYWLYAFAGLVFCSSFFASGGAANTGWTAYPPLSLEALGNGQDLWILSIHILTISSAAGRGQLHRDDPQHAHARDVVDADPAVRLVGRGVRVAADRRPARALGRADDAAARTAVPRHVPLLPTRRVGCGWLTDPVPARVLVLRAPRGLHHGAAGVRDHLRGHPGVRAQADLRLQGRRVLDGRDRLLLDARVGAPHVRGRDADLPQHLVHARLDGDRRPDRDEDLQLARDALARKHQPRDADALLPRLPQRVHDRRPLGDLPRRVPRRLAGHRHVLRRRALPLRPLRRLDAGADRRALVLVAEDLRALPLGADRQVDVRADLRRLQRDVLPAAPARSARHAPAHVHLPPRRAVGGLQHDLDDRLVHHGARASSASSSRS